MRKWEIALNLRIYTFYDSLQLSNSVEQFDLASVV
jgi:hypothetical protein